MVPGSAFAAVALVALVPGFAYLRLSESARHPRQRSSLEEFLEVAAAGLLSTGIAALFVILVWPGELAQVASPSWDDPEAPRKTAGAAVVVVGLSLGIALIAAWLTRLLGSGNYAPDVWHATLGRTRDRHMRHVDVELKADGRIVGGVLHAYTAVDGDHARQLALKAPLTITNGKGEAWSTGADFVIVDASEIAALWLKFELDEGQPASKRGRGRCRST